MMVPSTKTKVRNSLPLLSMSSLLRGRADLIFSINILFDLAVPTEEARSEKWARTFLSLHLTVFYVLTLMFCFLSPFVLPKSDIGIFKRNVLSNCWRV